MGARLRRPWQRLTDAVSWTRPTSTEIGTVAKSGLAAGLSWPIARAVTGVSDPVLAPLTALVVVQVSVRASVRTALQRSARVVLGVLLALALGDVLGLNGLTVGVLVAVSLGVAELVLRLPACGGQADSHQRPRRAHGGGREIRSRRAGTEPSAPSSAPAVGVVVSLVLPASRLVDARQTLDRLAASLGDVLDAMGAGLAQPWSTDQTQEWRRRRTHGA